MLPADTAAEYAKADRALRDYDAFFHENFVQRSLLADNIAKLNSNIARTVAATDEANKEIGYRQTEQGELKFDLEKFQHEQQAIAAYHKSLEDRYQQVHSKLKSTYVSARQRAGQLTAEQLRAAQEIDRRTGAAAR
jgi:hypothetical protein